MKGCALRWWALAMGACLILGAAPREAGPQNGPATVSPAQAAEEKEACTRNLKVIYDAIQAYQFDHKDLPNWLSDLVPDYLADGNVLTCPVCRRTGKTETPPLADPKLACSYVFEFSPVTVGQPLPGEPKHTRREWKRRQMGLVGSSVPMVRCRQHSPVLNLAFNGSIYDSPPQWELMFTNRIRPSELSVRAIFGGASAEDPIPSLVVNPGGPPATTPDSPKSNRCIDLARFYNATLDEPWLGSAGDDLSSLPKGFQTIGGIRFDVSGVLQLKGNSAPLAKFPAEVKNIPVHQRCQHLYFLHAATLGGKAATGDQIGSYMVHLSNNEMILEIPIFFGRTVRGWHPEPNEPGPDKELNIAWTGENAATRRTGKPVRLFVTAWNLAPGVDIDSLDFVSASREAAPFLVAISFD
jgi:hypothetical protein